MMTIIDLARNIRECHNKPLKTPLKEMIVVHPDADFLDDIGGKLKEARTYVFIKGCKPVHEDLPNKILCSCSFVNFR
ncbi:putative isoleucine--tRNA ligase [Helianthus anomalus]